MNMLNFDSDLEKQCPIFIFSMIPSECIKIHENDITALPKRIYNKLKEYIPPYPDEKDLIEQFNKYLKRDFKQKEIVTDFLNIPNHQTQFAKNWYDILKTQMNTTHNQLEQIANLKGSSI